MKVRTSTRTYYVSLPMIVTVRNDGRIAYEVDTAEAAGAVTEEYEGYVPLVDADLIAADVATRLGRRHVR